MALLLTIDTAQETASAAISRNGIVISARQNTSQKDHAAWLHPAVKELCEETGYTLQQLDGIGVTIGPGSYTGLRVGLSAAKGFCYALDKPLITTGTLEVMAMAVAGHATDLVCPLIDARRMEVFTAVYDKNLVEILQPTAMVVDENSFEEYRDRAILFCGSGSKKLQSLLVNPLFSFSATLPEPLHLAKKAFDLYQDKTFADLAYTEPLYVKEFYSSPHKPLL